MSTERPRYTVSVDQDLFQQIEDYKFKMRYSTRSDATVDLIEKGLSVLNEKPISQIEKSPVPAEPRAGENALLQRLTGCFNQLNEDGQERLAETADDMVRSGKYIKSGQDEMACGT